MQLCETTLVYRRERRFYIDGKPVSKARFEEVKQSSRLDSFTTETKPYHVRQLCCASPRHGGQGQS